MYRLYLALRYLMTRPINLLGMLGITLSVWALVVVVSLFSGFLQVIEEHVQEAGADVAVTNLPEWADWTELATAIADDPNVAATAPRIVHFGLVNRPGVRPPTPSLPGRSALHGGDQPFLFVYGIDPAAERRVSAFGAWITAAEIPAELRAADPERPFGTGEGVPGVLIGLERMQREGLGRGDTVILTTGRLAEHGGEPTFDQFSIELRVAGAFKTRHGGFDGNIVFLDLAALRDRLTPEDSKPRNDNRVQEIAVKLRDDSDLDGTARRLQNSVHRALDRGTLYGYGTVETWRQRNAGFLASVQHQRWLLKIVLFVILVVAAFLMLATLSMMVTEKTGDIGILTSMGGTPSGVTVMFLLCGLTVTVVGIVLGTIAGVVTSIYLEEIRQAVLYTLGIDLFPLDVYNLDRVPCAIDPWWLIEVAAMALGTGFLASALPAWRAARHDPLVSLRGI